MLAAWGARPARLPAGLLAALLLWPGPLQAFFSAEDEQRIGDAEHPKLVEQFGGAYDDPGLAGYIASVGDFLAATSDHRGREWTFTVLDNPVPNAFALPGGYVYVTRGLLALANSEAEIASVIGHEIGHVVARHAAERNTRGALAGIVGAVVGEVVGSDLGRQAVALGAQGVLAQHSQADEFEADSLGIGYMRRAGYDVRAAVRMHAGLGGMSRLEARLSGRPAQDGGFFATHPSNADRLERAMRLAGRPAAGGQPIEGRDEYLDKIDGLAYGESGEEGFVRDGSFLHPQLGFAFTAPPGFRYENRDHVVLAWGPDGTVIVFDGVRKGLRPALEDHLADDDDDVVAFEVNGMEAVTGIRRSVVQDRRSYDIRTVLVRWDGAWMWRFRFRTPPSQTFALERELLRTTHSFRRLGPEEAGTGQLRIRVVEVGQGDDVAALARRMEGAREPEALFRALNGIPDGEDPAPGTRVKIVAR